MNPRTLTSLLFVATLLIISGCANTADQAVPAVRIITPTWNADQPLARENTATPKGLASLTKTPRPSATALFLATPTPMPTAPRLTLTALDSTRIQLTISVVVNATSRVLTATAVIADDSHTITPTRVRAMVTPAVVKTSNPVTTTNSNGSATDTDWYPCAEGQIKANRNSSIYHVPSGQSYAKTRLNVQCFGTEAQAQEAGFRRAKR